jgi:hypothetical protein
LALCAAAMASLDDVYAAIVDDGDAHTNMRTCGAWCDSTWYPTTLQCDYDAGQVCCGYMECWGNHISHRQCCNSGNYCSVNFSTSPPTWGCFPNINGPERSAK